MHEKLSIRLQVDNISFNKVLKLLPSNFISNTLLAVEQKEEVGSDFSNLYFSARVGRKRRRDWWTERVISQPLRRNSKLLKAYTAPYRWVSFLLFDWLVIFAVLQLHRRQIHCLLWWLLMATVLSFRQLEWRRNRESDGVCDWRAKIFWWSRGRSLINSWFCFFLSLARALSL